MHANYNGATDKDSSWNCKQENMSRLAGRAEAMKKASVGDS